MHVLRVLFFSFLQEAVPAEPKKKKETYEGRKKKSFARSLFHQGNWVYFWTPKKKKKKRKATIALASTPQRRAP